MHKIGKFVQKSLLLTIFFLLIMLFKIDYRPGGGWLISSPSLYTRGWPVPYVVWDISTWPREVSGSLTLEQLAHEYSYNNVFLANQSLGGLVFSFIFWFLVSMLLVGIHSLIRRLKQRKKSR